MSADGRYMAAGIRDEAGYVSYGPIQPSEKLVALPITPTEPPPELASTSRKSRAFSRATVAMLCRASPTPAGLLTRGDRVVPVLDDRYLLVLDALRGVAVLRCTLHRVGAAAEGYE